MYKADMSWEVCGNVFKKMMEDESVKKMILKMVDKTNVAVWYECRLDEDFVIAAAEVLEE